MTATEANLQRQIWHLEDLIKDLQREIEHLRNGTEA